MGGGSTESRAVLGALAKHTALEVLDLSNTEISDPAPLVALPHLHTLGLAETTLSRAGIESIKTLRAHGVDVERQAPASRAERTSRRSS